MANSITTDYSRTQMAKARAGDAVVTKVTQMAFGDGGVDAQGNPKLPLSSETALFHETFRKAVDGHTYPIPTTCEYSCELLEAELADQTINEIALFDETDHMVCKKTFRNKVKDGDMKMAFKLDDIY
ncbi:MAG: phage tail protein [Syntrophomonas sp.]